MPDLSFASSLDMKNAKLFHGTRKRLEKLVLVGSVELDERPGPRVLDQRVVRSQKPQSPPKVLVVHVVELARRHHVVESRHSRVVLVVGARPPERVGEFGVDSRVGLRGGAEVEKAVGEFLAVREADSVTAGESHHFLDAEAFVGEDLDHGVHAVVHPRQVSIHARGFRDQSVFSAQSDFVERTSHHRDQVPRRLSQDIRARHYAWARQLQRRLRSEYHIESIA